MKSVLLDLLILPSTLTTRGHRENRWISSGSSCCTSQYVGGDEITRDRPGAKYLRLIYVRQRTKWFTRKVRDLDSSSARFVIAPKSSITNIIPTCWFCKNHNSLSVAQYRRFPCLLKELLLPSRKPWIWRWVCVKGAMVYHYFY